MTHRRAAMDGFTQICISLDATRRLNKHLTGAPPSYTPLVLRSPLLIPRDLQRFQKQALLSSAVICWLLSSAGAPTARHSTNL